MFPRRAFQACLLTWWLPWEQPDSGRLCTSLLGGIVRTERRFKGEESLGVFMKKNTKTSTLKGRKHSKLALTVVNSTEDVCF